MIAKACTRRRTDVVLQFVIPAATAAGFENALGDLYTATNFYSTRGRPAVAMAPELDE